MQVHAESLVTVNEAACHRLAALLRAHPVPDDTEEIKFEGFASDELSNLLLFVVAICHQTSIPGRPPLAGVIDGRELRGWDYLLQRYVEACRVDKSWLTPANWSRIEPDALRKLYRNAENQDLLSDIEGRAALVKDLGQVMEDEDWPSAESVFRYCEGRINSGQPNLIECLGMLRAFSDPVRKKSYFYLALMRNTGLWIYRDPELLGPPVDYHEVRGHLRIGTVSVLDAKLRAKLLNRELVTAKEDIAIRKGVFEAIMLVSEVSGIRNPSKLHYLFWNILRNFCTRENPNCLGHRVETYLPERYRQFAVDVNGKEACPFNAVCRSVHEEQRYHEHVFATDYY